MNHHRALLLCALLISSPACALFDALGDGDTQQRADMAATADMAADQGVDLPVNLDMDDADMSQNMPQDMQADIELPIGSHATFEDCAASECHSGGGTCVLTQRARAIYTCASPAQLSTCLGQRTLQGADAAGPLALTLDGEGGLHAFGAAGATLHHYAKLQSKRGALAASHSTLVAGDVLAIAAQRAQAALAPEQLIVAYTAKEPDQTSLGVYAWHDSGARTNLLSAWPTPYETTTNATLAKQPCNDMTRLTMRAAPPSTDGTGQVVLTACLRAADSSAVHVTLPLRVPVVMPMRAPVWGVGYAATGYTVEDAGLDALAGEQFRVRFLSAHDGAIKVREARWTRSDFMQGDRPLEPGGEVTPISGPRWQEALAAICGSNSLPALDARHMILPSPLDAKRALVFVKVAGGVRVIEWDDVAMTMSPIALNIICGTEDTDDVVWEDRVGIGELGWLALASGADGEEALVMGATWRLDELATQRLIAAAPLSMRALAASDREAWAIGSLGAAVFVAELTREGAPVCVP